MVIEKMQNFTNTKRIRRNAKKKIAAIFDRIATVYCHSDFNQYIGEEMTVEQMKEYYYRRLEGKSYVQISEDEEKFIIRVTSNEWYELYKKEAERTHFENIQDAKRFAEENGLRHIAKTQNGTYVATANKYGYPANSKGLFYWAMLSWYPLRQYTKE